MISLYIHKTLQTLFTLFVTIIIVQISYGQVREYEVKSAMIGKLADYVTWSEQTNTSNYKSKPFVITVLGKNPFDNYLDKYKHYRIKNKVVKINYIDDISELKSSDILFISSSNKKYLEKIIETVQNKPILTIADSDAAEEAGVIIIMKIRNERIYLTINQQAAYNAKLHINSILLNYPNVKVINKLR